MSYISVLFCSEDHCIMIYWCFGFVTHLKYLCKLLPHAARAPVSPRLSQARLGRWPALGCSLGKPVVGGRQQQQPGGETSDHPTTPWTWPPRLLGLGFSGPQSTMFTYLSYDNTSSVSVLVPCKYLVNGHLIGSYCKLYLSWHRHRFTMQRPLTEQTEKHVSRATCGH